MGIRKVTEGSNPARSASQSSIFPFSAEKSKILCGVAVKRSAALATEIKFRGIFERAIGARQAERSSVLTAKLHAGWIVKFALRAAHRQPPNFLSRFASIA
jgi:hypothetical protein